MLYIPLTRIKKYMSCDNFCKQPSAVLLYSVTGFLLSISFWGHMYRRQTENEFLETAFSATDQTCEKEKRRANWSTAKWVLTGLPSFYLPFGFTIIHRSGRLAKNREGQGAFITWMTSGGRELGGRRGGGAQLPKQHTGPSIQALYCVFVLQTLTTL